MPPVALTALSLVTDKDKATNMCVTLWAYIDERDGRLLEAGLERTIISSPRTLSFANATALLDGNASPGSMSNTRAILSVAKPNLSLWSQRHNQCNQAAQKQRYCCPYWSALDTGYFFNRHANRRRITAIIMVVMADERPDAPWI